MMKWFSAIGAVLAWSAVLLQLYLMLLNLATPLHEALLRFFTYFTILTNILVATMFTFRATRFESRFNLPPVCTAVTVYILVVGITYNVLLRQLWQPEGLQWAVDELLHTAIPLYCLLYWIVFIPKAGLSYSFIPAWLIYPAAYLAVILFRGHFAGWYPYPFTDVELFGYPQVLLNCLGITLLFVLLSTLLVGLGKQFGK